MSSIRQYKYGGTPYVRKMETCFSTIYGVFAIEDHADIQADVPTNTSTDIHEDKFPRLAAVITHSALMYLRNVLSSLSQLSFVVSLKLLRFL